MDIEEFEEAVALGNLGEYVNLLRRWAERHASLRGNPRYADVFKSIEQLQLPQDCPCGDNDGHFCTLPGCPNLPPARRMHLSGVLTANQRAFDAMAVVVADLAMKKPEEVKVTVEAGADHGPVVRLEFTGMLAEKS
ncbi:MAG: hypothetical protein KDJ90_06835 [Nitratireductor sp.]|nr:hypothetical protein [Nitratireductor sp.]